MANSKLSMDGKGDKYVGNYDAERFLSEEEASHIDWKKGIRIILIGKTGEGKSATGNTMMGQKWFESDSSCKPVTEEGKAGRMKWKDQHIKIVDTPGFFDNKKSEKNLELEMKKCMTLILPGPHIIMYVIRIGRYTNEDIAVADKFFKILDENPYKHMIIVLTGRDDLEFHDKTTKSYLETAPSTLNSFGKKCRQRYIFVDNRSKDSKREWIKIYTAIEQLLLENKRSFYTNKLLQKLNEVYGEIIAKRARVDTSITIEEIIAALEKEVENKGSILYTLFTNASVGALSCGLFSTIFGLTVPLIVGGAMIGAGGAVVGVGGKAIGEYAFKKVCTIS